VRPPPQGRPHRRRRIPDCYCKEEEENEIILQIYIVARGTTTSRLPIPTEWGNVCENVSRNAKNSLRPPAAANVSDFFPHIFHTQTYFVCFRLNVPTHRFLATVERVFFFSFRLSAYFCYMFTYFLNFFLPLFLPLYIPCISKVAPVHFILEHSTKTVI
jgi:hypothetical protein